MKKTKILFDEVTVRHVTCPYCAMWINNMSQVVCEHLEKWNEDYVTFKEIKKEVFMKNNCCKKPYIICISKKYNINGCFNCGKHIKSASSRKPKMSNMLNREELLELLHEAFELHGDDGMRDGGMNVLDHKKSKQAYEQIKGQI